MKKTLCTTAGCLLITAGLLVSPGCGGDGSEQADDGQLSPEAEAQVEMANFEPDRPVVHVTYRISQGQKQKIREVLISGNLHTQDRVIRRQITVEPGQDLVDIGQRPDVV